MRPGRPLEGKGALVTGASSGIGRAVALRLGAEGASVLCCDLRDDMPGSQEVPTHEVIVERGGEGAFRVCDVGDGSMGYDDLGRNASIEDIGRGISLTIASTDALVRLESARGDARDLRRLRLLRRLADVDLLPRRR